MPACKLHIDKIDDKTEPHTVGDIPSYTSEQQCKRSQNAVICARRPPKEIQNERRRNKRHDRQSPSPGIAVIVEHRKSDACILGVGKIQKAGNDRSIALETQNACRPGLGGLVDHKYAASDGEIGKFPEKVFLSQIRAS